MILQNDIEKKLDIKSVFDRKISRCIKNVVKCGKSVRLFLKLKLKQSVGFVLQTRRTNCIQNVRM